MPAHKVKIILNPNADLGRAWRSASDFRPIVDEFGGADWSGTVYPTHAVELARQAAEDGYELVISAGGDGTVHEVINGLMQLSPERRPRLGVLPMGSGNDFAHAIGMDAQPAIAMRQILSGKPRRIDIGKLEDSHGRVEYWDNTVGIGFDATVTIRSRKFTYLRGFVIYFLAVLQTVILNHDAAHLNISTDEEQWEEDTLMLVLCNGAREGGGFYVQPQARNNDGILHYTGIRRVSRPMMMRLIPEVMSGTHGRFSQVRMGQFQRMQIESDRSLPIHIDGEIFAGFGVDVRQLSLDIMPNALEVMV
ncbi:MAG: diacylglycerol kinase family lipid kinase [Anaerolineales bacterium]|nr:MAG: diacylglycerol kinase family lipid kinase [Anaerolineales bacterium]